MRDRLSRISLGVAAFAMLAACSSGGGNTPTFPNPTPTPTMIPTPQPSGSATSNPQAFTCPTSDTPSSGSRLSASTLTRKPVARFRGREAAPTALEVTYRSSLTTRSALATREASMGVHSTREFAYPRLGKTVRVVQIGAANANTLASTLRAQSGVLAVTAESSRRREMSVTTPYYPNDPYFQGFTNPAVPNGGVTAPPSTYHVLPYVESADVPGQWNMHAIGLEHAMAYGESGNGSGITNAGALGLASVKIAVIDTGADTTIPELQGKIVTQGCFITNPSGAQSTGNFVTDEDGHGTDVSGIAAANTNNSVGFTGAGGNATIAMYRIDPTPDDNCTVGTDSADAQCSANVEDVADAIDAAVTAHANVINLSLGGGECSTAGVDDDAVEGTAIANAVSNNVVVVASAGNSGTQGLSAPACDTGVIAAGATGLADGVTTGAGTAAGSASAPIEYVASYSQYGSPAASLHSASAWGIVAPGGDPADAEASGDASVDDLHWIEDVWTSTPFDTNFEGECYTDYPNSSSTGGTISCRTLIAGTSMSSPEIAGAAALIISANSAYQSPSAMKTLLCQTADDIGDAKEGCGRLNVYRAMATAVGDTSPP